MEKTTNYNLNKPEPTDPLRVADFNENSDVIDTALAELAAAMPKIVCGTYIGTGMYGTDNPNTLKFEFQPKIVFITANTPSTMSQGSVFIYGQEYSAGIGASTSTGGALRIYLTWNDCNVVWYNGSDAERQLNAENTTYYYLAIG